VSTQRTTDPFLEVVFGPLSSAGLALGVIMLWFSLGSSLLPRSGMMQGVVSALSFAVGYALGALIWLIIKQIAAIFSSGEFTEPLWLRGLLLGAVAAVFVVLVVRWPGWQTDQRLLVGLEPIDFIEGLKAVGWALALSGVLMLLGRSVRWLVWRLDVFNTRHMSVRVARGVTIAVVAGVLGVLYWFIASSGLTTFANERFGPGDETTLEGIVQPSQPEVSGSPESLVAWDDLGYQGRTFTGAATSVEDIVAFYPESRLRVKTPIRVYAGLKSATSVEQRAQLVVDELVRTNAQDRAVVVVVSTTGTGWVDPVAAAAIEYMYQGDTAIAGMQYSFLPSWISFVLDTATSTEAGIAINDAVIEWWDQLPENDRPRLIAFGESLGTLGSEAAYVKGDLDASLANVQSRVDGALWIGPTNANPLHSQLVSERDPSPVWRPVYDEGRIVRSLNMPGEGEATDPSWSGPRVVYYHHPSDPVGYWNWETLWQPQEWTDDPVGYDVPESVRWVPFTTFTQVVVDLINGFSASVGHGHNYNDVFVEGWSIVAPVDGWTPSDTSRLQEHLASIDLAGL
jgi:uncharacterized membrane protein